MCRGEKMGQQAKVLVGLSSSPGISIKRQMQWFTSVIPALRLEVCGPASLEQETSTQKQRDNQALSVVL